MAAALRGSTWAYPLVNAGHVAGVALLFGAIAALDLRLLGLARALPVRPLAALLVPVGVGGFAVAALTGALLFITAPADYARAPLFQLKLAAVALGGLNALLLHRAAAWRAGAPGARLRAAGLLSLALWLAAIVLGRLVGYFIA